MSWRTAISLRTAAVPGFFLGEVFLVRQSWLSPESGH
jgi:hypothetical protein